MGRGEADIFFPTNFRLLREMYKDTCFRDGVHMKSWEFMEKFSREKLTTTRSGYNPLKEDFMNTSFFVTNSNFDV